jgi:hypothetical protein
MVDTEEVHNRTSTKTSYPSPTLARPNDGSFNDLLCAVCYEIPLDPVISPCDHVYCLSCISEYAAIHKECPVDKRPLDPDEIKPLNGILNRVWSNLVVKCPNEWCSWNGVVGNYRSHIKRCHSNPRKGQYVEEIRKIKENFKKEKEMLMDEIGQLEWKVRTLEVELSKSRENVKDLEAGLAASPSLDSNASYKFDRTEVIALSQLICKYIDEKPAEIDRERIYNVVKARYDDLRREWDDNPEFYECDVAMLLSICRSSSWFTDKQHENIREWARKTNEYFE